MTREEAIKIIKRTKAVMVYTEKEKKALEILIQELSESDDEKIANAIKLILSEVPMERFDDEGVDYAKCLEYIEKQKEQKHDEGDFTIYHPLKNGKGKYECIPYSFYGSLTSFSEDKDLIDFLRTCFYTEEECNEWIEQQKEQKQQLPLMGGDTDTYFDDLRMTTKPLTSREWFNEGIKYAKRLQKEQKPAESISQLTVQGKGVYKICPHCKERMVRDDSKVYTSIPPQYGYNCPKCGAMEFDTVMYDNPEMEERKPSKWSDTDNIGWDEALACVTKTEEIAKNEEELQNAVAAEKWLKEIKFKYYVHSVKQEWSEEDEKTLISVIRGELELSEIRKEYYINRLKSLRPPQYCENCKLKRSVENWKPSEHQMNILKAVKEHVGRGSGYWGEALGSLINDLEKLM